MENLIVSLNNENLGEKKARAKEDLELVRESLGMLEARLGQGLTLTQEETETMERFIAAEKQLEREVNQAQADIRGLILELQDASKDSSDIMKQGKQVTFKDGVSIDTVHLERASAREIKPRRNRATMEIDIKVLFERHKETIERHSIKSVRALFALFYPNRHLVRGANNERKMLGEALVKFWDRA